MAVAILTRKWSLRPPPGAQINWGHPITRGLVGAWLFNQSGAASAVSLLNPADALALSGSAIWSPGSDGIGVYGPNSGSLTGAILTTPSTALQPTAEVSLFWRGVIVGDGSLFNNPPLLGMFHNNANSSPFVSYGIFRRNTGQANILAQHSAGGSINAIDINGAIITANYGLPVSYSMSRTSGHTSIYRNADLIGSDTASGSLTYGATPALAVNRHITSTGESANTISEIALAWNREITQEEYRELHENPHCFIIPQRVVKSFDPNTTLSPSGISSAEAFGALAVYRAGDIYPVGIGTAEAFGTASIGQILTVSPSSIASAEAFGTPSVTDPALARTLSPSGIASTEAFGTSLIVRGGIQYCLPQGITSAGAFGFPAMVQGGAFRPLKILIAGKNFRSAINPEVTIERRQGGRAGANFTLMCLPGVSPIRPRVEQSVKITENGHTLFVGSLNSVVEEAVAGTNRGSGHLYLWECQAVDLAIIGDRRTVDKTYAAGSFKGIILDMAANFLDGENLTTNNVLTTASIPTQQAFAKKTFTECMNTLCAITGDMWFIDEFGDINCFAPGAAPAAPFSITSTSNNVRVGFKVTRTSIGLATQVFARSNQDLGEDAVLG